MASAQKRGPCYNLFLGGTHFGVQISDSKMESTWRGVFCAGALYKMFTTSKSLGFIGMVCARLPFSDFDVVTAAELLPTTTIKPASHSCEVERLLADPCSHFGSSTASHGVLVSPTPCRAAARLLLRLVRLPFAPVEAC